MKTYGERRPYAVPERLDELNGPFRGQAALSAELGWTGRLDYNLDDPADAAVFYERVLVDAVRVKDIAPLINADRLRVLWPHLYLPVVVRRLWEDRFPALRR